MNSSRTKTLELAKKAVDRLKASTESSGEYTLKLNGKKPSNRVINEFLDNQKIVLISEFKKRGDELWLYASHEEAPFGDFTARLQKAFDKFVSTQVKSGMEVAVTQDQFDAWKPQQQKQWLKDHPTSKFGKKEATKSKGPIKQADLKKAAKKSTTQEETIKFKTPAHKGNDEKYVKEVLKAVDKYSTSFAGVPLSKIFQKPNGDFNLYGPFYFYGKDNEVYSYNGVDTENWKGFSVRISKVAPDTLKKVPKSKIQKIPASAATKPASATVDSLVSSLGSNTKWKAGAGLRGDSITTYNDKTEVVITYDKDEDKFILSVDDDAKTHGTDTLHTRFASTSDLNKYLKTQKVATIKESDLVDLMY